MDQIFDINIFVTIVITSFMVIYLLYKCSTSNFKHWEERGVPYVKPLPFVGNFWKILTWRAQIGHYLADLYNQFNNPYFGIFILDTPHLIVKCPDLIKSILVKDFQYFNDRTVFTDEKTDSMGSKFLFFVKNPEWKFTRTRLSPAFSTGKLKNMTGLMNNVAKNLKEYIRQNLHEGSMEAKDIFARFATDIIGTCAFGIEAYSFKSRNPQFREIGRLVFDISPKRAVIQSLSFVAPNLIKYLRFPFFDPKFTGFMRNVFWETVNDRKKSNYKRNDLIDHIMQLKEKSKAGEEFELVGDRIAGLAGQFFAAGFETVSSVAAFTLYELCLQPDIQNKAREEIKSIMSKYGEITYEAIKDMKYLEMILNESLRKYPTLPFLDRVCIEDYKVPNSDFVIEKGTPVYIPVFGLHYDSIYFPDPEKFDPERFSNENKDSFPEYAFIPFGKGPRSCIGARFGFLVCALGLAHILSEFEVVRNSDTPVPLVYEKKGFLLASTVGLPVAFRKL
ncbi:hypothetical protein ILUMI_26868 [Ignelater luminosus]|uniref:Cytochrome P450 n=1 Tax=Ignelater luminosus TaxID=2038154 RepID=A0A8K0FYJ0_IGNLU|nr:hypothetical protein ILUMI_26868 [Ignelater luminosus]